MSRFNFVLLKLSQYIHYIKEIHNADLIRTGSGVNRLLIISFRCSSLEIYSVLPLLK